MSRQKVLACLIFMIPIAYTQSFNLLTSHMLLSSTGASELEQNMIKVRNRDTSLRLIKDLTYVHRVWSSETPIGKHGL